MDDVRLSNLSLSEPHWMALTMWGEARGEPLEGILAVGQVIMNRVRDRRWPDTIRDVVLQRAQFSCWNPDDPNYPLLVDWAETRLDPLVRVYTPSMRECVWCADGVAHGFCRDLAHGATHYHVSRIVPKWAYGKHAYPIYGNHSFYRGID